MARIYFSLIFFWIFMGSLGSFSGKAVAAPSIARPTILITYFKPYAEWKVNSSSLVARDARKELKKLNLNSVYLCELPVSFRGASETAKKCLARLPQKPNFVISLGQSADECYLTLESVAARNDNVPGISGADNPAEVTLNFDAKHVARNNFPTLRESNDMGRFVCNATAYQLGLYLQKYSPRTQFGFFHVPNLECYEPMNNLNQSAKTIAKMLGLINQEQVLEAVAAQRIRALPDRVRTATSY